MKILQIGKYYYPTPGGIETVLKNLSEGLVEAGHEVTVLCASENLKPSDEIIQGVRVRRLSRLFTLFSQPIYPQLIQEVFHFSKIFDLIHLHLPNPFAEAIVLMLPKQIPIITSYHSDIVRQRFLLPFYAPLLRSYLHRSKQIVVATKNHIKHSSFLRPFKKKCIIIPYGVNIKTERGQGIEPKIQRSINEFGKFILFVGRLVTYKGLNYLISAMQTIEAPLIIIGDGPLRNHLGHQTEQLGLSKKIHFMGRVSSPELVNAYYEACAFLVLPSISRNEAFGLVQLEAMAHGKPVITTQLDSGVTLICQDGITGRIVPPKNITALGAAIQEMLQNDAQREKMGKAAHERFLMEFTRDKMVQAYQSIYREIISS